MYRLLLWSWHLSPAKYMHKIQADYRLLNSPTYGKAQYSNRLDTQEKVIQTVSVNVTTTQNFNGFLNWIMWVLICLLYSCMIHIQMYRSTLRYVNKLFPSCLNIVTYSHSKTHKSHKWYHFCFVHMWSAQPYGNITTLECQIFIKLTNWKIYCLAVNILLFWPYSNPGVHT